MIDFHCHLNLYPEPVSVIDRCRKQGIHVLSVTTTPSSWHGTRTLDRTNKQVITALGLHPQLAHERKGELELFDELLPKARCIGEIGLDGTPDSQWQWQDQIRVFEHILFSCQKDGSRIMSIHSRRASREVLDFIEVYTKAGIPILHWFSGSFTDLKRAIAQGCWFSVGPAMLHSAKGRALVVRMPRDRILTESDGPFAQIKKHILFPWDVREAISELGKLWEVESEEVEETLNNNLRCLLKLI